MRMSRRARRQGRRAPHATAGGAGLTLARRPRRSAASTASVELWSSATIAAAVWPAPLLFAKLLEVAVPTSPHLTNGLGGSKHFWFRRTRDTGEPREVNSMRVGSRSVSVPFSRDFRRYSSAHFTDGITVTAHSLRRGHHSLASTARPDGGAPPHNCRHGEASTPPTYVHHSAAPDRTQQRLASANRRPLHNGEAN